MLTYLKKFIDADQRKLKHYYKLVNEINRIEPEVKKLTDEELKAKTIEFRKAIENGKKVEDLLIEAFAVVREASNRVLGMRHYDVQLIGGMVLLEGNIAEMATGEGKTLVASLPSYLRALEGKGVHVITVNEYLARRDREIIGQIHEFLGLSVGLNVPGIDSDSKKKAYLADITYGMGNEFGFDHLRDNMVLDTSQRVQLPYHYAIIDEVDSVLVDEAKTPLIIAGKTTSSASLHNLCARIIKFFKEEEHFLFDEETKAVSLTDHGIEKIERGFDIENLYDLEHQTLYHYVIMALRARVMFKRDVDYIVKEGKVLLVDMFTGRVMEGRTLSNGLHQAIEAKEGLAITEENKTQAQITIQNYFRLYPILSGMTGTAKTEESEFRQLYDMEVFQIPTNKPVIRNDMDSRVFLSEKQKYEMVTKEVEERHKKGQPVLIGTTSILQSEEVANYLDKKGLQYQLLNAKSVEQEVAMIAMAGQKGQITIATNMAGRGTDIMLGEGVAELGGLHVLGTQRHESRRIDNQLKGRAGRQGDPGSSQFIVSLEDDIIHRFGSMDIERLKKSLKTDEYGETQQKSVYEAIDRIQRISEGSNYSMREYNLKLDNIINDQRSIIYELRNNLLESKDIVEFVKPMAQSYASSLVEEYCPEDLLPEEWDLNGLQSDLEHILSVPVEFPSELYEINDVKAHVETKITEHLNSRALEELKINDLLHFHLKKLMLVVIDEHWIKHLEAMEHLKEGIGLRSYGQEDPMRQYQREGLEMFTMMYQKIERDSSYHLKMVSSKKSK